MPGAGEHEDGDRIRQYTGEELRTNAWPWLIERGYASSRDREALEEFLSILGRRPAHLRPGLRFKRRWGPPAPSPLQVREDVNAILAAADDATL